MSPRASNEPERVSFSQSRHASMAQGLTNMASRSIQDDDLSSQDTSLLCSIPTAHGNPQDMKEWNMNTTESLDQAMSSKESPQVQMLSFSLSQHLMTPTVGPNDVMYTGVDFPAVQDLHDQRDFYSFVDLSSVDNDVCGQASSPDDALSVAHSSHTDDGHYIVSHEPWNAMMPDGQYPGTTLDQLSSSLFQTVPVSPPLTEASNDISVTSSCSHPGFPSYMAADDTFLGDFTNSPMGSHGINPADPMFPSAPLSDKDPNRTIRPTKQSRRGPLEPHRQKSKDGAESRNPREHQYYSMPTQSDGKYYCPFAVGDKACNHQPTTQKCAYHKYLDSHLKPYRCKVPTCLEAQLRFSSNACLFRHEREAHGLHGHGDNPHLCLWEGCDRSIPGFGFPPHQSPRPLGLRPKKKETSRKRKVTGPTPAPIMKRTRSVHSQSNSAKATSAQHGQRLQNAERNYYKCRERLVEELRNISPQDTSMHEKVNASLQELFTLGLNYRHIDASQAVSQMPNGMPV
ncbi:uncharacterized protein N7477_007156 [Penicillium maclennaniae]|uniref:uncharacterized protein n=1 Tax=Penicillium maclennaniae TaxID=1343394 RepID=UPI00253F6670|nr:uncharacterized protein N7477_007156 [Penicillium maclennaniae]KAJ5668586.1 hypothetical protein N7477_007156 [Penicillium maclennaniae]